MARKTVFDDVFRTICQKMPHLLIPLVNEAFGTDYSESEQVTQLRNERFERNGEIITDALLQIRGRTYHIECQSKDETTMVIRMIEYDFSIALEYAQQDNDGNFHMNFPESCVVYLRNGKSQSRKANVSIHFPNGNVAEYEMKTICAQDYSKDEIFQKNLLMLLPFYILRYEKVMPTARKMDAEKLNNLLDEYKELFHRLENTCKEGTHDFTDLYNLSIKIINHVVKSKAVKRRFEDMGGKILMLESEKIEIFGAIKMAFGLNCPVNEIIDSLMTTFGISKNEANSRIEEYRKANP